MSEEIRAMAKADITAAEVNMKDARDLINRLRQAGEDVAELERKYQQSEQRLRRFKAAFGE